MKHESPGQRGLGTHNQKQNMKTQTKHGAAGAEPPRDVDGGLTAQECGALIDRAVQQRRALGIPCSALASTACLAVSTVSRFERKMMIPGLDAMVRYCRACGLRLELVPVGRALA